MTDDKKIAFVLVHPYLPPIENVATLRFNAFLKYLDKQNFDVWAINGSSLEQSTGLVVPSSGKKIFHNFFDPLKRLFLKSPLQAGWLTKVAKVFYYYVQSAKLFRWRKQSLKTAQSFLREKKQDYKRVIFFSSFSPLESHQVILDLKKEFPEEFFWIADMRDEMSQNWYYPWPANKRLEKYEPKILASADLVTVVSEGQKEHFNLAPYGKEAFVIQNGYDFEYKVSATIPSKVNAVMQVIYTGSLESKVRVEPFLDALRLLSSEERRSLKLLLVGNVPEYLLAHYSDLKDVLEIRSEWLSYPKVVGLILKADLCLLIDPALQRKGVLPVKLTDYMGARKTVFALSNPEALSYRIVDEGTCGYLSSNQSEDILVKLRQALSDFKAGTLPVPSQSYAEKFSRVSQVKQLEDKLLSSL